eukprot:7378101-Prymnesium_polylepis.1
MAVAPVPPGAPPVPESPTAEPSVPTPPGSDIVPFPKPLCKVIPLAILLFPSPRPSPVNVVARSMLPRRLRPPPLSTQDPSCAPPSPPEGVDPDTASLFWPAPLVACAPPEYCVPLPLVRCPAARVKETCCTRSTCARSYIAIRPAVL